MRKHIPFILLTVVVALGAAAQTDPIAVLQSAASPEEKAEACRLISISGDVNAIPVLEPLLADELLSHMARYALEPMSGTEADAALRRALAATSGTLKAGIVASIGVRHDTAAVPDLIALLADADGFVIEAAARALGRIGAPDGITAMEAVIAKPGIAFAIAQALSDGLFTAAENLVKEEKGAEAVRIYDAVYAVETLPVHIRGGALRGALLARAPKEGIPMLLQAVQGEHPVFFAVALRTAQEMKRKGRISVALAAALPSLSEDRKIQVMQTLGELGKRKAGPAVLAEAETGPTPVRIAALAAATRLAHVPALPLMAGLVASGDADLAKAARDGLSYFPGKAGDAAVQDMLKSEDAAVRRVAVELVGQGALPAPAELLMQVAVEDADESVRVAALKGVKGYAGMTQLQGLLDALLKPRSNDEMIAAEDGLKSLCDREKAAGTGAIPATEAGRGVQRGGAQAPAAIIDPLCDALASTEGEPRLAVIRVLTSAGSQKAFDTILPLAASGDAVLKEAATRAVCDWPETLALPTLMEWVKTPPDGTVKALALRGAVRLLNLGQDAPEVRVQQYASLLALAASPEEKKLLLSGLANVAHASALNLVLDQAGDEAVKAEAVQAALTIAKNLGTTPQDLEALARAVTMIPEISTVKSK